MSRGDGFWSIYRDVFARERAAGKPEQEARAAAKAARDAKVAARTAELEAERVAALRLSMTCAVCGKPVRADTGRIARHGYRRPAPGSPQTPDCPGSLALPREVVEGTHRWRNGTWWAVSGRRKIA